MLAAVTVPRHCPVTARTWRRAPAGQSTDEALHQARKAANRARYASEAMAPGIGKKASRFANQMKKVQSVLGDHQDAVIAPARRNGS
jgi:CHAD domain-containing protein